MKESLLVVLFLAFILSVSYASLVIGDSFKVVM